MKMTAKTLTGIKVTITNHEIIIENGKPLIMFFTKSEHGHHGIFPQHHLTDYSHDYGVDKVNWVYYDWNQHYQTKGRKENELQRSGSNGSR